jgi:hypothetical protein
MAAPDDVHERIENRLMSHGIYVTDLDPGEETLNITYETVHGDASVPVRDIGRIVNLLRTFREEEDWGPVTVHGTATDLEGDSLGTWQAEQAWFEALADGEMTEVEFSDRVRATIDETAGGDDQQD